VPRSYLLLNNGQGRFSDGTDSWSKQLANVGMVTDAAWSDINNDGRPDLVLTGEWMAPMIFFNLGNKLETRVTGLEPYTGWWNTIELFDMDDDNDLDIIAGNWGLNSQLSASPSEPVTMTWKDFDSNGSIDPFLSCFIQGLSYPFVSRDELLDQIYPMRRKFTSYKSYADATLEDLFDEEEMKGASRVEAKHFETTLFENVNGRFVAKSLPVQAQFSPVYKIITHDWNKDGHPDILLLGNNDHTRLRIGKMDSNFGTVILNDGKGNFRYAGYRETGLLVAGDVKDACIIGVGTEQYLLIGINNSDLVKYKLSY
jgi:hypothetical protein